MPGRKLMILLCCGCFAATGCGWTDSPNATIHTPSACNGVVDNGKCVELRNGKIFVDGKEQPALRSVASAPRQPLPQAPVGVARIPLVYDREMLANFSIIQGKELTLPQFYLVDLKTGRAADVRELPEPLARFVRAHANPANSAMHSLTSPTLLDSLMAASRHADGAPLQRSELVGKQLAAFQLWASWCAECITEAKELSALLRKNPMPELAWITLETDPEALTGSREAAEAVAQLHARGANK